EALYQAAREDYHNLLESPTKRKHRDQWEKVIQAFEAISLRFPDSRRADDALYNAGQLTVKLHDISRSVRDTKEALRLYERLAREYPKSRYADDAQYMIGEIHRRVTGSTAEAYAAYEAVPRLFPGGDMVGKAKERLALLPRPAKRVVPAAPVKPVEKGPVPAVRTKVKKGPARVLGVRHRVEDDYVRVVIDVDRPVEYQKHALTQPNRVYVSLHDALFSRKMDRTPIRLSKGDLKAIRMGQYEPYKARVVLDFAQMEQVHVFTLTNPDRIVMDVAQDRAVLDRLVNINRIKEKLKAPDSSPTLSEQLGMKVSKVVIDAGHGGKDPGCIGKSGLMEKDITLDIALRLKSLLEENLGLQVIMTRDRDVFVPLEERTEIANRAKADLFVSIHVNAAKNRSLRGVETWFLDLAASEHAKQVAARENTYSTKAMSDLETILNDLLLNNKTQESSRLAEILQGALTSDLSQAYRSVKDLGVKGAPFMVLQGAKMPSVLSEVSFMSNPTEEKRLHKKQYRHTIAQGLYKGIRSFVRAADYAYRPDNGETKRD
ncbi:MAG: N-acetylmuramoyl-L-alanine amidase, partial [bacterium]|nr:N-acetylmuramoyl-L-alanine amidase [bacterium]